MMRKLISFIIFFFLSIYFYGQTAIEKGLLSINEKDARTYIGILASDSLGGRKYGQPGGEMATEYIKNTLVEIGIPPWKSGYFQPYNFYREIYKSESGKIMFTPERMGADTAAFFRQMEMRNVLGYIEGKNKDEIIVIGAHHDHLGINPKIKGDNIFNGADDNASGVSAVLQIAKAFKAMDIQPMRSVIFAFFDGEEKGLIGSSHFVDIFERDSTIHTIKGFINCDMVGRGKNKKVIYFTSDGNPIFKEWITTDISRYNINLTPNFRSLDKLDGISDHNSFATHGIPIIFYHTGTHSDYHKPSDHADKINYEKMVEITKAAFLSLWNMANETDF